MSPGSALGVFERGKRHGVTGQLEGFGWECLREGDQLPRHQRLN